MVTTPLADRSVSLTAQMVFGLTLTRRVCERLPDIHISRSRITHQHRGRCVRLLAAAPPVRPANHNLECMLMRRLAPAIQGVLFCSARPARRLRQAAAVGPPLRPGNQRVVWDSWVPLGVYLLLLRRRQARSFSSENFLSRA